jgi:hypothetical protein
MKVEDIKLGSRVKMSWDPHKEWFDVVGILLRGKSIYNILVTDYSGRVYGKNDIGREFWLDVNRLPFKATPVKASDVIDYDGPMYLVEKTKEKKKRGFEWL